MAGRNNHKKGEGPKPEVFAAECPGERKVIGESYPVPPYSKEMCEAICDRLVCGQTLRQISGIVGFPDRKTIYTWRMKHPDFFAAVDVASEMGDEAIMDECIEIADNPKFDYVERLAYHGPMPGWELNGDAINRSRQMIDIRKFRVGKRSKRYSDNQTHNIALSTPDGPIQLSSTVKFVDP